MSANAGGLSHLSLYSIGFSKIREGGRRSAGGWREIANLSARVAFMGMDLACFLGEIPSKRTNIACDVGRIEEMLS